MKTRFITREISVGDLKIGGELPIVVQSMTTTDTMNIQATVDQVKALVRVGCPLVRITAPTVPDAEALKTIRESLDRDQVKVALVADIHFVPSAAMVAADYVEKVRINPGNYVDRKLFKVRDYTDLEYQEELERIHEKFKPLVLKLKSLGRALRIGTNHGSLSDRIMNRFGDSPEGMVESAFEFADICRTYDFHNFCFSMKASNVQVMTSAYRLLVEKQMQRGWDYPIHLGVTEAGDGEDGRMKSAVGIGSLLREGIGDTIRVSLTESPLQEVPVASSLAKLFSKDSKVIERVELETKSSDGSRAPLVWWPTSKEAALLKEPRLRPDVAFVDDGQELNAELKTSLKSRWSQPDLKLAAAYDPTWTSDDLGRMKGVVDFYLVKNRQVQVPAQLPSVFLLDVTLMQKSEFKNFEPHRSLLYWSDHGSGPWNLENFLQMSVEVGSLFVEHAYSGVWIDGSDAHRSLKASYDVLQATRRRMSKTEYISCPSCGRTLFDLEETTARIKEVTHHLKGVKIAVMGCIVNGPGEMADADFGYVGGAPGRVNLYVGKECIQRNIPSEQAPQALVDLIKQNDRWVEPT